MICQAVTNPDGSWQCERCNMYGDNDEQPECLTSEEIAERTIVEMKARLSDGL